MADPIHIAKKVSQEDLHKIVIAKKQQLGVSQAMRAQVVAVYDISGSTEEPYAEFYSRQIGEGLTVMGGLSERVLALGMSLDDNGVIPVYAFNNSAHRMPDMTKDNIDGYVESHFLTANPNSRYRPDIRTYAGNIVSHINVGGGTAFAPVMRAIIEEAEAGDPMLVLFFTDGENQDQEAATDMLVKASHLPIFWQFFGVYASGREPKFEFLHSIDEMGGRTVDNAGFSPLSLFEITDDELMDEMLHEFRFYPDRVTGANGAVSWGHKSSIFSRQQVRQEQRAEQEHGLSGWLKRHLS